MKLANFQYFWAYWHYKRFERKIFEKNYLEKKFSHTVRLILFHEYLRPRMSTHAQIWCVGLIFDA